MTRDEAREILTQESGWVHCYVWTWFGRSMVCPSGCCDEYSDTVEEALDRIERYCGGDWSKIDVTF